MQFVNEKKIPYFKVSAKTGEGVDILLNHIINSLIEQFIKNNIKQNEIIKVDDKKKKNVNNKSLKTSDKKEKKKNISNNTLLKPTNKEEKQKFLLLDKFYNY